MDPFQYESELAAYSKGQTIFNEGETGRTMYVVAEGAVEVQVNGETIELIEKGGIFGEMALLGSALRSATAVARDETRLLVIDDQFFMHLIQQSPHFSIQVMKVMADRLRRLNKRI
jgi:CRP/FNR family transcriptional regulator, cyclic AMP receptor protein